MKVYYVATIQPSNSINFQLGTNTFSTWFLSTCCCHMLLPLMWSPLVVVTFQFSHRNATTKEENDSWSVPQSSWTCSYLWYYNIHVCYSQILLPFTEIQSYNLQNPKTSSNHPLKFMVAILKISHLDSWLPSSNPPVEIHGCISLKRARLAK